MSKLYENNTVFSSAFLVRVTIAFPSKRRYNKNKLINRKFKILIVVWLAKTQNQFY
jgi:hypothetical protein